MSTVTIDDKEHITILLSHYEKLERDSEFLDKLYVYGLSNWEGLVPAVLSYLKDNDD